jgi:hypothetical protein
LKRRFFPLLDSLGFAIDNSSAPNTTRFRRAVGDGVQILEVQWEKYGRARFVVNFGTCPAQGLRVRGETFPADQVMAGWLDESGRLQPGRGSSTRNWFSQEKPWLQRLFSAEKLVPPPQVVDLLLKLFPEVEAYWAHGAVGRHLRIMRIGPR